MKIKITLLIALCCIWISYPAQAAKEIGIYIDDIPICFDVPPVIEQDRTLVPIRGIFEHLAADVGWDKGIVTITAPGKILILSIGSNQLIYNDTNYELEVAAKILNDRTYIPLRAIAELINCSVIWDGENQNVYIYQENTSSSSEDSGEADTPPSIGGAAENTNYAYEQEVFLLVNEIRAENGMQTFEWSDDLATVGRNHAEDMYVRNFFSHKNPDNKSPFDRMKEYGISYMYAAENIAQGQKSPQEAVNGWMNSAGHRENILNPNLKKLGVGFYKDYWCQLFSS